MQMQAQAMAKLGYFRFIQTNCETLVERTLPLSPSTTLLPAKAMQQHADVYAHNTNGRRFQLLCRRRAHVRADESEPDRR